MRTTHRIILTDEYIAETQRLSIAQNATLRFIYQYWWIRWLSRVVMVGFIVYSLLNHDETTAALFGTFLVISFWAEWFGRRSLAKARQNVRSKGSTTIITMAEDGIDIDGALGKSHLKWAAMFPPVVYPQGVLVKFSRQSILWLPDQTLAEGSPEDVRSLLALNVSSTKAAGK